LDLCYLESLAIPSGHSDPCYPESLDFRLGPSDLPDPDFPSDRCYLEVLHVLSGLSGLGFVFHTFERVDPTPAERSAFGVFIF
jgi:hypothetical protein